TAGMLARQDAGIPVHHWQPVQPTESAIDTGDSSPVHRIMTSDLYKVKLDDTIDLVTHLMHWKHLGHVPVEDARGRFAGIITRDTLLDYMLKPQNPDALVRARELMTHCALTIGPDTPLKEVLDLMVANAVSCLPVTSEDCIVGLVTKHDLVRVAQSLVTEREAAVRALVAEREQGAGRQQAGGSRRSAL
ncbi:MAG: CBS domain-containing protein, partial [Burkholderiales bacterium]